MLLTVRSAAMCFLLVVLCFVFAQPKHVIELETVLCSVVSGDVNHFSYAASCTCTLRLDDVMYTCSDFLRDVVLVALLVSAHRKLGKPTQREYGGCGVNRSFRSLRAPFSAA